MPSKEKRKYSPTKVVNPVLVQRAGDDRAGGPSGGRGAAVGAGATLELAVPYRLRYRMAFDHGLSLLDAPELVAVNPLACHVSPLIRGDTHTVHPYQLKVA
jgi:hypothetical protein